MRALLASTLILAATSAAHAGVEEAVTDHALPATEEFAEATASLADTAEEDCPAEALRPAWNEAFDACDAMEVFATRFNEYGIWAVLIAGVTPFPFKVITIMSGWSAFPLIPFVLSALVARALRFFIVAGLLRVFGPPIRDFIERRLGLVFTLFCVALVGGFMVLRVL